MSSAGTVPHQGTTAEALAPEKQQQLAQEKKRGSRGQVGKGTPGSRLKGEWRATYEDLGPKEKRPGLKKWARDMAERGHPDAQTWLESKGGGTPEERSARRLRRNERRKANRSAKDARRSKGKGKQPPKADR